MAEKAKAEGAWSKASWKSVVDATLEDRAEFGEIHDEDLEQVREDLMNRFQDFADENGVK